MSNENSLPVGTPVIVRARDAGVHFGLYQGHRDREVILTKSRRLWYWKAAKSVSLSGVAAYGLKAGSKIAPEVAAITILDACEIIPTTDKATASITEYEVAEAA